MITNTNSPEVDTILRSIDDAFEVIQAGTPDAERLRRPTPKLQQALVDSGVFRSLLPKKYGGAEASCMEFFQIIEKLSHANPSLGWIARVIAPSMELVASGLDPEIAEELFGGDEPALVAGQSSEYYTTKATKVEGGYQVTAESKFIPGLSMAKYVYVGVDVDGEQRILVAPRADFVLKDNWEMLGLKASGTLDYECKGLFVPERYSFTPRESAAKSAVTINRLRPSTAATLNQSAWAQGVGKRLLLELNNLTQSSRKDKSTDVTSAEFYAEYARHYSHTQGTGAFAANLWAQVDAASRKDDGPDMELQTMVRLCAALSTRTMLEICQLSHRFAGGHVMRDGVLQRLFRDGHAGTQHRGTGHLVTQECGEFLTGARSENAYWGPEGLEEKPAKSMA